MWRRLSLVRTSKFNAVSSSALRSRPSFPLLHHSAFSTAVATNEVPNDAPIATEPLETDTFHLKPSQVVAGLDLHIVGQADAKRAVAIALRNRWRRSRLDDDMKKEVTPRNVLLIGPTGCGKTEVARRMSLLNQAPFLKVEATKFTEVGYHGRDVDSIIRDLMDVSMQLTRNVWTKKLTAQAKLNVTEVLLNQLAGPASVQTDRPSKPSAVVVDGTTDGATEPKETNRGRESFRDMLLQGMLDDQEIEVELPKGHGENHTARNNIHVSTSNESNSNDQVTAAVTELWARMSGNGNNKRSVPTERKRLSIAVARELLTQVELEKLLDGVDLKQEAITAVEESGIVFLDEIDKICSSRHDYKSADASAEGVQRDLLPLIEGTTISTKYGNVNTDYILFIASGAFHAVKPSDLLPELQGRLPIRVELKGLTEADLYRILTEPVANLVRQQVDLIATEGVTLVFDDDAVREIARRAAQLNSTVENIGARRLHTVMESIMEELSFTAAELPRGSQLHVTKQLVDERLAHVMPSTDISKYIL